MKDKILQRTDLGFIQKGNRYFIQRGASTIFTSGFKNKKQFNEWLEEEFRKHGLDWRAVYRWKYKDNQQFFILVKFNGEEVL